MARERTGSGVHTMTGMVCGIELEPADARGPGEALYRRADPDTWLAGQQRTGPVPAEITRPGPGELVALYQFADLIGRRHATVYQYRHRPGFPQPTDGVRYPLGDLLAWWNDPANRPGQGRGGGGWRRPPIGTGK